MITFIDYQLSQLFETRLVLSKLMRYNHTFRDKWTRLVSESDDSDSDLVQLELSKQRLIDATFRSIIEQHQVYRVLKLGHSYDQTLTMDFFRCAADEHEPQSPCR